MTDRANWRTFSLLAAATVCCAALEVGAVVPSFWTVRTQAAFASGELDNITVDNRGSATLSPSLDLIAETGELYVWSLARDKAGIVYVGTGNEGKIFKLEKPGGELKLWCDLEEPDVLSLVCGRDGELFAGTSASGTIYRIDSSGKASIFHETGARYVWTLVRDEEGTIYAGTGDAGRIYQVDADGVHNRLLFDSPETHVMSLIAGSKPESLYAGGEGRGIVYEISLESGRGFVLYEVTEREVSALALAADGTLYVGATSGPAAGPEPAQAIQPPLPPQTHGSEMPANSGIGAVSVDSSISSADWEHNRIRVASGPSPQMSLSVKPKVGARGGTGAISGSALYAIAPDGVVVEVWRSTDDALHALAVVGDDVLIGTGNKGYVYRVDRGDQTSSTLVQSSASQITAILPAGKDRILVGSANMADLLVLGTGNALSGTVESPAHDASTWSKWGRLTWEGDQPKGTRVQISTRGGNTSVPDSSWSEWAPIEGEQQGGPITGPNSRFLQWRAELESSKPNRSPALRSVAVSYQQRNLKPQVLSLFIAPASENAAPKGSGGKDGRPSGNRRGPSAVPGRPSVMQPANGESTIRWRAHDANGDELTHSLFFRELDAEDEGTWTLLEEGLETTSHPLDSTALPDGMYVIKAVSTDEPDNPAGSALTGERVSDPFPIDNTNPDVVSLEARRQGSGLLEVSGIVEDGTGPLWRGQFAIDGGEWKPFFPSDEIFDSKREAFTFVADLPDGDGHTLVVRVSDLAGNIGAKRIGID